MEDHEQRLAADADELLNSEEVVTCIQRALEEDIGTGDITTAALVPDGIRRKAVIISNGDYVISGNDVAVAVFKELDAKLKCEMNVIDGEWVERGQAVIIVEGQAQSILTGERTALNFVQRMSGIATLTRKFVEKVNRYGVMILDTRKTTPTLRILEKYAVRCGGGTNHRRGLYDRALIKENHIGIFTAERCMQNDAETMLELDAAVEEIRKKFPDIPVEIEVEDEAELKNVLKAVPDWILLDNMSPEQLRRCVELCAGRSRIEASGGITLENVEEVARSGVDAISLGCLTHSAPAADLSLEWK